MISLCRLWVTWIFAAFEPSLLREEDPAKGSSCVAWPQIAVVPYRMGWRTDAALRWYDGCEHIGTEGIGPI